MTAPLYVCVPWRPNGTDREANWIVAKRFWEQRGLRVIEADSGGEPFSRSPSINQAAAQVPPDQTAIIIADADIILDDLQQIFRTVSSAASLQKLTFAHTMHVALDLRQTEMVHRGTHPRMAWQKTSRQRPTPNTFSSCLAVPRRMWDTLHGFDEAFRGWGFEDLSFMRACGALGGGLHRTKGLVFHMHHERFEEQQEGQPHYKENWARWDRYMAAGGDVQEILKVRFDK